MRAGWGRTPGPTPDSGRLPDMRRSLYLLGTLALLIGLGGLIAMAIISVNSLAEASTGKEFLSAPISALSQGVGDALRGATSALASGVRPGGSISATTAPGFPGSPHGAAQAPVAAGPAREIPMPSATATLAPTATPTSRPSPTPEPRLPITALRIASIGLETQVVQARYVQGKDGGNWEVPAFVAGHADLTAGAGAPGNAVLLGHVDSIRSGDVFRDLGRVAMGDLVEVWSGNRRFEYRVVAIWSVPRTDGSVMQPTPRPSLTAITCTGQWLPVERDFSHRLVVRAELSRSP